MALTAHTIWVIPAIAVRYPTGLCSFKKMESAFFGANHFVIHQFGIDSQRRNPDGFSILYKGEHIVVPPLDLQPWGGISAGADLPMKNDPVCHFVADQRLC